MSLPIGTRAPNFTTKDQDGKTINLSDFKGKKVVLYFYPKDMTPGCTAEACSLRDNYKALQKAGYEVLGISSDDEKMHKKFIAKEIDICNASRPAKKEEITSLAKNGIKFEEIKVAYDGLSIVVNPKNTFVDYLSVEELAKIWGKDSKVKTWADIRPTWPAKPIKLSGPGTDSGTFDFFTEAINGKAQVSRSDYTKSENDNVLVQGVSGDENALAYFGHAYVEANKSVLKVVPVGSSLKTAITPTSKTIKDGTYKPLSRPLFVYVNKESLKKAEVKKFLTFMINNSEKLVTEVGYVPLQVKEYKEQTKILAR